MYAGRPQVMLVVPSSQYSDVYVCWQAPSDVGGQRQQINSEWALSQLSCHTETTTYNQEGHRDQLGPPPSHLNNRITRKQPTTLLTTGFISQIWQQKKRSLFFKKPLSWFAYIISGLQHYSTLFWWLFL